jgi:hypothetical protein
MLLDTNGWVMSDGQGIRRSAPLAGSSSGRPGPPPPSDDIVVARVDDAGGEDDRARQIKLVGNGRGQGGVGFEQRSAVSWRRMVAGSSRSRSAQKVR